GRLRAALAHGDQNADAAGVVAGAVRAGLGPPAALVDGAVLVDDEVVADARPAVPVDVQALHLAHQGGAGAVLGHASVPVDEELGARAEGDVGGGAVPRAGAPLGTGDDVDGHWVGSSLRVRPRWRPRGRR